MDSTAIEFQELESLLGKNVKCNNTLLVFDVGHKLESDWSFSGGNLVNRYLLNLFSEQEGRAVLVSSGAGQVSMEREGAGGPASGLFTYWLLQAMAGKADLNGDAVVTAEEMFGFVAERVRAESEDKQAPRFRIAGEPRNLPVATGRALP
jgi:hypothetical protein